MELSLINIMIKDYCKCELYARIGRKKYHPTEHNSFLIGRPVIEYCVYCGKEKLNIFTTNELDIIDRENQ